MIYKLNSLCDHFENKFLMNIKLSRHENWCNLSEYYSAQDFLQILFKTGTANFPLIMFSQLLKSQTKTHEHCIFSSNDMPFCQFCFQFSWIADFYQTNVWQNLTLFKTWAPSDIWSERCLDEKKKRRRDKETRKQKDKDHKQSLILWCQGSFALFIFFMMGRNQ